MQTAFGAEAGHKEATQLNRCSKADFWRYRTAAHADEAVNEQKGCKHEEI